MAKRKSQINNLTIFLEKVRKSTNSQTNIKSSGNDSLTTKLYKRVSNESPIL